MSRARTVFDKIVYGVGCIALVIALAALAVFGIDRIEAGLSHQRLRHGYVTEKYTDGENYWYSSWVIGDLSITKRHGGEKAYCVTVQDGETTDYWTISYEQWTKTSIGDYIGR